MGKAAIIFLIGLGLSMRAEAQLISTDFGIHELSNALMFHGKGEHYDLDLYLRDFGFKGKALKDSVIWRAYERVVGDSSHYEMILLSDIELDNGITGKFLTLRYNSFDDHKMLHKGFSKYRYVNKNISKNGLIEDCVYNEYGFEYFVLFQGVSSQSSEAFVRGGYMLFKGDDVLSIELEEFSDRLEIVDN